MAIWQPATSREPRSLEEHKAWIVDQVTLLGEAFGEFLTSERLRIYAEDLSDLGQDPLATGFIRARRESPFFPKIAELRKLAGADGKLQIQLEAEHAWQAVELDIARRGRDACPIFDECTEYAIRAAGGMRAIDRIFKDPDVDTETFKKKDFVAAFANYEAAERLGLHELAAPVRQLLTASTEDRPQLKLVSGSTPSTAPTWKPPAKPIPRPLSDDEVKTRRALLAKQAEEAKFQASCVSPEERARVATELRESSRKIAQRQIELAEQKRQEALSAEERRADEFKRRQGVEFYLQLVSRARHEGWEVTPRKSS